MDLKQRGRRASLAPLPICLGKRVLSHKSLATLPVRSTAGAGRADAVRRKKFVAFVTGLMAWTAYCSLIALYPEYTPTPGYGNFDELTLISALTTLMVWIAFVLPYIRYVERTA